MINEKNAVVEAHAVTTSLLPTNKQFAGIAVSSRPSKSIVENHGVLRVHNANVNAMKNMLGIITIGKDIRVMNTGLIDMKGKANWMNGITALLNYSTGYTELINQGVINIEVLNPDVNTIAGISFENHLQKNLGAALIENTGKINLKGNHTIGIEVKSLKDTKNRIEIRNSGEIYLDKNGYAAIAADSNLPIYDVADHVSSNVPVYIYNTGHLSNSNSINPLAVITGRGNDYFAQTAGEIIGNIQLQAGDDQVVFSGGRIRGKVLLGDGNDLAMFSNTDISALHTVDGGRNPTIDRQENSFLLNQSFSGSSFSRGDVNNTRITNWDNISIGTGPESVMSLGTIGAGGEGVLNLTGGIFSNNGIGRMLIGDMGTLALQSRNAASYYHTVVMANGRIDLTGGSIELGAQLVIGGRYAGHPGSELHIKSSWNNPDIQKNDSLTIRGNAQGKTRVWVPNGIIGDVTSSEAEKNGGLKSPVVTVEGHHDEMFFHGTAQTTNAGEAQLKKVGNRWYWTLQAVEKAKEFKNLELSEKYEPPISIPTESVQIYNPSVPSYVQLPYINREMGLAQLGRLNQRIGEIKSSMLDKVTSSSEEPSTHRQVWARLSLDSLQLQGATRLGSKVRSGFVQFGRDLRFHYQEGKLSYTGLMASYGWANSRFYDKYRAENGIISADKYVGHAKSELFSLGGYYTIYRPNGIYMDTIGQFSLIKNRHGNMQAYRVSQSGYSISTGVEFGKMFKLTEKIGLEPQTQLMYQWLKLDDFHDGYRQVKGTNQHSMTARAGARLTWSKEAGVKPNIYFSANS